jgi:hypothetical protein
MGGSFDMQDEEIGLSVPPPVSGVRTPLGDPNSVEPHTDVIRTKLLAAMKNENLSFEDRQSAERLFNQMYPEAYNISMLTDLKRRGVEPADFSASIDELAEKEIKELEKEIAQLEQEEQNELATDLEVSAPCEFD